MKFLEKYGIKKNLYYADLAIGVVALITFLFSFTVSADSYESAKSMLTLFVVLFYIYLIIKIGQVVIASFQYFYKKDKDKLVLASFVMAVIGLVVCLLNFSVIRLINAIIAEDFMEVLSLASSASNAETMLNLFKFTLIADTALAGYIGYLMFVKKELNVETIALTEEQKEAMQENVEKMKEASQEGINKAKAYLATEKGKKTAIIVVVLVVFVVGFLIYNANKKTEIDMFNGCTLEAQGYDGNGSVHIKNCDIEYNKNNSELVKFVNYIAYDYDKNYTLSNGDEVKVTVRYNEELAEKLKVVPVEESKTFKVEGLKEKYVKVKQVPKKIMKDVVALIEEEATWDDSDFRDIDKDFELVSTDLIQKIYFTNDSSAEGKIAYVYKVSAKGKEKTSYFEEEYEDITQVEYFVVSVDEIDENFDKDNVIADKYRVYNTKDLTDAKVVKQVIDNEWYDNAEKFK